MRPTQPNETDDRAGAEQLDLETRDATVTFYWRPGCPFCSSLRSGLDRAGVAFDDVDIWSDPKAAAFVRSVANGNETVPTVTVGSAALVNPSPDEVLALVEAATGGR